MAHKKAESQSALGKIWVFTVHASKKIKATVEPRCWGWHTPASEGTRKAEAGGAINTRSVFSAGQILTQEKRI